MRRTFALPGNEPNEEGSAGTWLPSERLHPLHRVVLEVFSRVNKLDVATLAAELAGCDEFIDDVSARGASAYRIVAEDVLGYMYVQTHLNRDSQGNYSLPERR
jgi:hypothetical protein